MSRNRSFRRAQKARARANAKFIVHHVWRLEHTEPNTHSSCPWRCTNRMVNLMATTPKLCSCPGCGNRRRYEGVTIPELLNEVDDE